MPCTTVIAHAYKPTSQLSHLFNTNTVTIKLKTSNKPCSTNKFYAYLSRTMRDNPRPPGSLRTTVKQQCTLLTIMKVRS